MNQPTVSIVIPAIRTNRWKSLYDSVVLACKKYSFEILFIGPFSLPDSLSQTHNVKNIVDYGSPTRCHQLGVYNSSGILIYSLVDDCTLRENGLDEAIEEFLNKCGPHDIMNATYVEGGNYNMPKNPDYWSARHTGLPFVPAEWRLCLQFILHKERYVGLGGLNCVFDCLDYSIKDFCIRLQQSGGKAIDSPDYICNATWYPEDSHDHGPIHRVQGPRDSRIFYEMYSKGFVNPNIDYNNWKLSPEVWAARFGDQKFSSYEELAKAKGYQGVI